MLKFSSGVVCEITGLKYHQLERWREFGMAKPDKEEAYTLSQVIALAAAAVYRQEGASFERIVGIVEYLSKLPVERLEAELKAGRTFPVPATMVGAGWLPGMMIAPPKVPRNLQQLVNAIDLKRIYRDVMREVARFQRLPHNRNVMRRIARHNRKAKRTKVSK